MTNPAVIIVAGVIITVAAVIAVFASTAARPQAYDSRGSGNGNRNRRPSPPPSPILRPYPRKREKRRKSPERCSYHPHHELAWESTENQRKTCSHCGKASYVKVLPCNHESLCNFCVEKYLENNDKCPDCCGRIDGCSPPIPPFGKCKSCRKFTKLFKFVPCKHSLSLCISCFEKQGKSYKECPECKKQIRGCEPISNSSGVCKICDEFTRFAIFQPCGHANFCRTHAEQYLKDSDQECIDCGMRVRVVA